MTTTPEPAPVVQQDDAAEAPAPDAVDAPRLEANQLTALDKGRLGDDTRRAILALVRGPYLLGRAQPDLWRALLRDRRAVERHLGNMYLEMVLDPERQLAFVRNAEIGVDTPRVVRNVRLTLLDTALLLELRQRLLHDLDVTGRVFVQRGELEEALEAYRPKASTNPAGFQRSVVAAVEKLRKAAVLLPTSETGRFEISPVLAVVLDADEISAVTRELVAMRERGLDDLDEDLGDGELSDADPNEPGLDDEDLEDQEPDDDRGTVGVAAEAGAGAAEGVDDEGEK